MLYTTLQTCSSHLTLVTIVGAVMVLYTITVVIYMVRQISIKTRRQGAPRPHITQRPNAHVQISVLSPTHIVRHHTPVKRLYIYKHENIKNIYIYIYVSLFISSPARHIHQQGTVTEWHAQRSIV